MTGELQPIALPIISEETRQTLLVDLSMDKDWRTLVEIEHRDLPGKALPKLTESVFDTVTSYNSGFVQGVLDSLGKVFVYQSGEIDHFHIDSATEGMAIVLRAYQLESHGELFYNFGALDEADIKNSGLVIVNNMVPLEKGRTVLEKVLTRQRIPEQHAALNSVLNRASEYTIHYSESVREGGTAMFKVLSSLWSKLSPLPNPNSSQA